jgi:hypothetical protein
MASVSLRISDSKWASIASLALTGCAAAIVFGVHPGGFEAQGAWVLTLLPAALAACPLSDYLYRVAPHAEPVIFGVLVFAFNFLWYRRISYAVIKIRRFLGAT